MQITPADLLTKQKRYRERITAVVKPLKGRHGLFRQSAAIYESVRGWGAPAIDELRPMEVFNEGGKLVHSLEARKADIPAWSVRDGWRKALEVEALLTELERVRDRIAEVMDVCKYHSDQVRIAAARKKRKVFAETRDTLLLVGRAGDLRRADLRRAEVLHATLVEIIKPCLDDPSAFEKGVVKDPVEFTQAEVNRCVLFGWNGVLNNADMCHHLLMMLVPRCSAPPNPDPGSPLRGSLIHEIAIAFPRSLGTFGECADRGSPLRGSPIYEIAIPVPRSLGTFGEGGVVAGGRSMLSPIVSKNFFS